MRLSGLVRALVILALAGLPAVAPALPARPAAAAGPPSTWYLAEGTTRTDFDEFILVFNPNPEDVQVTVRYLVDTAQGTSPPPRTLRLAANSRTDVRPFEDLVRGIDHGTIVAADRPIVVERALYLEHEFPHAGRVNGAAAVFAVNGLQTDWSFAEGTTLAGFDTFYLLSNPGSAAITVNYSLGVSDGSIKNGAVAVPAGSRRTLRADELIGLGKEGVSAFFSGSTGFLAERAVYFGGISVAGSSPVNGTHAEAGARPATAWNFAEGTVLPSWYEFLTLGNPGTVDIPVTLTYQFEGAGGPQKTVTVPAGGRRTVQVFSTTDPGGVGRDVSDPVSRGVSVRARANSPFVMERPMYFADYDLPRLPKINDGHVTKGIPGDPVGVYAFAEGTSLPDFDTFFTFQNPNGTDATLSVTYFTDQGEVVPRSLTVPAGRRVTTQVWNPAEAGKGALGVENRGFGTIISSTNGVTFLVERPLYMIHQFPSISDSINGGTAVAGLPAGGNLTVGLTADRTEALVGETVRYSLDVSNGGLVSTNGAQVALTLPAGFSFQPSGSTPGCSPSGATVTCQLGGLAAGVAASVVVSATAGGPAVTAVARATAQGAGVAAGSAAASVVVAETTLAFAGGGIQNTGQTVARRVVVETEGGSVAVLGDIGPGAVAAFSSAGVGEAKGDNSTRATSNGVAHSPAGGPLNGGVATRSFIAAGGVQLRPDVVGGGPAIQALPAASAEPVGGQVAATVTSNGALTSMSAFWTESDGTRYDISSTLPMATDPSRTYYEKGGVALDTRQHGATLRPNGPGNVPNQFAQVLVHGVGSVKRTDGAHGDVSFAANATFTLSLRHVVTGGPDRPFQRWAEPGEAVQATLDYGGGFSLPADQDVVDLVMSWTTCPDTWSGPVCPAPTPPGTPARSIVFTTITSTSGFLLGGA